MGPDKREKIRRLRERLKQIDRPFRDVLNAPDPVERAHIIAEIARLEKEAPDGR